MALRSANMNVMTRAAEKAGRALVRDFGEVEQLQVRKKGPGDFVSNADRKAEDIILRELEKARPDFAILAEESGARDVDGAECRFIVDPLDGTTNFLHGIPHFAVSIALEVRGELTAGVIYDPVKDEFFWAEKGSGAWLRDRRLRVSGRRDMTDAVIATGIPHLGIGGGPDGHALFQKRLSAVMANTAGVRRLGAAALELAYVAAGRYEGFFERGLHPWDVAAGVVLVKEAGGFVSDIKGRAYTLKSTELVAANEGLHQSFTKLLDKASS